MSFRILSTVLLVTQTAYAQQDTVVRMAGAPRYAGVATLVEEMSIGSSSGGDEYVFGTVDDVAVAKDGTVYVLDNTIRGVRAYDAKGKYLGTIGRRGQGPGEIMSPSGIGVLPDGRLLLWDMGNWRINVYSPAGQSIAHWPMVTAGGGTAQAARGMVVDTSGVVFVKKPIMTRPPDGSRPKVNNVFLRVRSSDGAVIDTVREPVWVVQQRGVTSENGPAFSAAAIPFDPVPVWLVSPVGAQITGFPNRYAFEIHTSPRSVVSVRRNIPADAVSGAERDSARKAIEERMRQNNPTWSWNGPEIPRTRPFYEGIAAGLDGRIWITRVKELTPGFGKMNIGMGGGGRGGAPPSRNPTAEAPPTPSRPALFDVFEPDGTFLGQVRVPPKVAPAVRRGDYVWGVAYDEDDVPSVKRYRIVWR